jgi:regulatory protein
MKITAIKEQLKSPERVSLFVDGKYAFSLSINELLAEKLRVNQEVDDAELKRLKKLSADGKLKMRALEWVLNRPRSTREFKDYLYRKKAEPEQSSKLIEDFTERGYINDVTFAEWLMDVRRRGGKSERAIRNELMKKGISREVMAEAVQPDPEAERERLRAFIEKKGKLSRYKADPTKFMQYLLRQGFSYDDIKSVLAEAGDGSDG